VLWGVADEEIQPCHQAVEHFWWRGCSVGCDGAEQSGFAVFILIGIFGLYQSIGENDEPVARRDGYARRFILGLRLNSQRQSSDVEPLDQTRVAARDGIIVAGIDVSENAMRRIVLGKKRSSKA